MDPIIPILRFTYLFFNIYGTYKVLKAPAISPYDNGGPPNYRVIVQRRRDMEGIMAIWIVWVRPHRFTLRPIPCFRRHILIAPDPSLDSVTLRYAKA